MRVKTNKIYKSEAAAAIHETVSGLSQWERGEKHPAGTSLKLLSLVEKKGLEAIA